MLPPRHSTKRRYPASPNWDSDESTEDESTEYEAESTASGSDTCSSPFFCSLVPTATSISSDSGDDEGNLLVKQSFSDSDDEGNLLVRDSPTKKKRRPVAARIAAEVSGVYRHSRTGNLHQRRSRVGQGNGGMGDPARPRKPMVYHVGVNDIMSTQNVDRKTAVVVYKNRTLAEQAHHSSMVARLMPEYLEKLAAYDASGAADRWVAKRLMPEYTELKGVVEDFTSSTTTPSVPALKATAAFERLTAKQQSSAVNALSKRIEKTKKSAIPPSAARFTAVANTAVANSWDKNSKLISKWKQWGGVPHGCINIADDLYM